MDPVFTACRKTKERTKRPSTDSAIDSMSLNSRHLDDLVSENSFASKKINDLINSRYPIRTDLKANDFLMGIEDDVFVGKRADDWHYEAMQGEEYDLIQMIKNTLIEDRLNDKKAIAQLNDEVKFLKNEILHKNNVINILLNSVEVLKKQTNTSPRQSNINMTEDKVENELQPCHQACRPDENADMSLRSQCDKEQRDDCIKVDTSPNEDELIEKLPSYMENLSDEVAPSSTSSLSNSEEKEEVSRRRCSSMREQKIPHHIEKRGVSPVVEFPMRYLQRTKSLPSTTNHSYRDQLTPSDSSKLSSLKPIFIVGDSLLTGLSSRRIAKDKNIKIRAFPGGKIEDFYHYLLPLIAKTPSMLIIHCGTIDAKDKSYEQILDELITLKLFAQQKFENCNVIMSFPIVRADNIRASLEIDKLRNKLDKLQIEGIYHDNITEAHLTKKGFFLNQKGVHRLAMNYINFIRREG